MEERKSLKYIVYEIKKIGFHLDKTSPKDYGMSKKQNFKKKRK